MNRASTWHSARLSTDRAATSAAAWTPSSTVCAATSAAPPPQPCSGGMPQPQPSACPASWRRTASRTIWWPPYSRCWPRAGCASPSCESAPEADPRDLPQAALPRPAPGSAAPQEIPGIRETPKAHPLWEHLPSPSGRQAVPSSRPPRARGRPRCTPGAGLRPRQDDLRPAPTHDPHSRAPTPGPCGILTC